eukprot:TRINITY_DN12931_c0_g1_i1.p1 TRINITY_DN12931_c0_g1~~TRINITY_DN12931_c0_g1_i1.p1  ORF type:complete len:422 (+),score=76.62 TRINITY_DN12931_c0_g1_i1:135-1400(+)
MVVRMLSAGIASATIAGASAAAASLSPWSSPAASSSSTSAAGARGSATTAFVAGPSKALRLATAPKAQGGNGASTADSATAAGRGDAVMSGASSAAAATTAAVVAAVAQGARRRNGRAGGSSAGPSQQPRLPRSSTTTASEASGAAGSLRGEVWTPQAVKDIAEAGEDTATPHWSDSPKVFQEDVSLRGIDTLAWQNLHGYATMAGTLLFVAELCRFVAGKPPSDVECYTAAALYSVIYATRFHDIRQKLEPHFRVTFYATTGWCIYYIAHLLAATNPHVFGNLIYSTGIIFTASSIYFYKHWIERMWRHFMQDRFRPYYVPGLAGLMYFHALDFIDMMNQWLDPNYWTDVVHDLPDQVWTIQDVRLTGLFMSSAALFCITMHNKGVLTGGRNTLLTVLFTIFVPAFFLTGTHMTLQASFP